MLIKKFFMKIGEEKNWTFGKYYTFGYENDYFVQVRHEGISKVILIHYQLEGYNEKLNMLQIVVKKNMRKIKIKDYQVNQDGIVIFPNEFWRTLNAKKLQSILDFVIPRLIEIGLKPSVEDVVIEE